MTDSFLHFFTDFKHSDKSPFVAFLNLELCSRTSKAKSGSDPQTSQFKLPTRARKIEYSESERGLLLFLKLWIDGSSIESI